MDQPEESTINDSQSEKKELKPIDKICYQIKSKIPLLRSSCFYFMKDNKIIYMAKLKYNKIYIGEGDNFHIRKNKENSTHIDRNIQGYNIIRNSDQEFKIKYSKDGQRFPMTATFTYNGHKIRWDPKDAEYQEFIKDGSKIKPCKSKKNLMLQNSYNHPTFILRKMSKIFYEVECFPTVDPLIVFSIALSGIIGPISI